MRTNVLTPSGATGYQQAPGRILYGAGGHSDGYDAEHPYVTNAGYNIARLLVEDRLEGKDLPFLMADNESLWRVVQKQITRHYIVSDYHAEMKRLE